MKKLLLTNKYSGIPQSILEHAIDGQLELIMLDEVSQENLLSKVSQADYLLVSGRLKIDKNVIDNAVNLQMIQRTGVGLDNIDLDYLKEKGLPLYVNKGVNANSVAEHAVMLMLECLKKSYMVNKKIRTGVWEKQKTGLQTHEIFGKTIGLVGMGSIGRRVAEILSGFGVRILYYDMFRLDSDREAALKVEYTSLEELFKESDIVSLHCAMSEENKKLISYEQIEMMKDGGILINTARGGLVDTDAVVDALRRDKLSAVGLDAYETEPIESDSELFQFDQAILSPHIAGVSYEAFDSMMTGAIRNIMSFEHQNLSEIENSKVV